MAEPVTKIPPVEEDRERILHRLGERVKELTALHGAASTFQQQRPIPELLQEFVSILPPAWQYPDATTARIVYNGNEFRTAGFAESRWRQSAGFTTVDGKKGTVEVFYTREMPPEAEGPFLAEERNLINSLAEILRVYLDRKLSEDALQESEERFRITFEQAAVGIVHVGLDGRILRANQKFCDIVEYSYDEITKRTFQDVTCVHDVAPEMEYRDKLMAGRVHAYTIEKRYIRKDGKPVWVNETVSLVRGADGEPRHFIFVLEDITERKQAEKEKKLLVHDLQERVKELTAMYRTMEIIQQQKPVPELLQEVVSILPPAWQYPEVTATRIVFDDREYRTPNFAETAWVQATDFATYDAFDGFIEVVYLEERPEEDEGPFLAEERDLINSLARLVKGFLNRRKAEKALEDSEALYRTLAEAAHDMVYIMDSDGRFTYFNRYARDLIGEDPEEYIGKRSRDLYHSDLAGRHGSYEERVMKAGEPVYFEELAPFPRRSLWTANWLVPIKDEHGNIGSLMCVVRDIDGRKRAEENVLRAEKEVAQARRSSRCLGQVRREVLASLALLERGASGGSHDKKPADEARAALQQSLKKLDDCLGGRG